jgi:hypothetical protein
MRSQGVPGASGTNMCPLPKRSCRPASHEPTMSFEPSIWRESREHAASLRSDPCRDRPPDRAMSVPPACTKLLLGRVQQPQHLERHIDSSDTSEQTR